MSNTDYLLDGTVPPAVQAMRSHMLDADINSFVFRNMAQLFETRPVGRGGPVTPLPAAHRELPAYMANGQAHTLEEWFERTFTNAFMVIRDGKVLHESYRNHAGPQTHFWGASVSKSVMSLLVGIAIDEGAIASLDDQIVQYLPELAGTGYDGVTLKQALQMRSGVDFDEILDAENQNPPYVNFQNAIVRNTQRYWEPALTVGRRHEPGTFFAYCTLDSAVVGWVLTRTTGTTLSALTASRLWQPAGMEFDAFWMADGKPGVGVEPAGLGFNATMRDFARLGLLVLNKGKVGDRQIVPADWIEQSTQMHPTEYPAGILGGPGYGFQWWQLDNQDGRAAGFSAVGLGGQFVFVDPPSKTVIVKMSHFPLERVFEQQEVLAYFHQLLDWSE